MVDSGNNNLSWAKSSNNKSSNNNGSNKTVIGSGPEISSETKKELKEIFDKVEKDGKVVTGVAVAQTNTTIAANIKAEVTGQSEASSTTSEEQPNKADQNNKNSQISEPRESTQAQQSNTDNSQSSGNLGKTANPESRDNFGSRENKPSNSNNTISNQERGAEKTSDNNPDTNQRSNSDIDQTNPDNTPTSSQPTNQQGSTTPPDAQNQDPTTTAENSTNKSEEESSSNDNDHSKNTEQNNAEIDGGEATNENTNPKSDQSTNKSTENTEGEEGDPTKPGSKVDQPDDKDPNQASKNEEADNQESPKQPEQLTSPEDPSNKPTAEEPTSEINKQNNNSGDNLVQKNPTKDNQVPSSGTLGKKQDPGYRNKNLVNPNGDNNLDQNKTNPKVAENNLPNFKNPNRVKGPGTDLPTNQVQSNRDGNFVNSAKTNPKKLPNTAKISSTLPKGSSEGAEPKIKPGNKLSLADRATNALAALGNKQAQQIQKVKQKLRQIANVRKSVVATFNFIKGALIVLGNPVSLVLILSIIGLVIGVGIIRSVVDVSNDAISNSECSSTPANQEQLVQNCQQYLVGNNQDQTFAATSDLYSFRVETVTGQDENDQDIVADTVIFIPGQGGDNSTLTYDNNGVSETVTTLSSNPVVFNGELVTDANELAAIDAGQKFIANQSPVAKIGPVNFETNRRIANSQIAQTSPDFVRAVTIDFGYGFDTDTEIGRELYAAHLQVINDLALGIMAEGTYYNSSFLSKQMNNLFKDALSKSYKAFATVDQERPVIDADFRNDDLVRRQAISQEGTLTTSNVDHNNLELKLEAEREGLDPTAAAAEVRDFLTENIKTLKSVTNYDDEQTIVAIRGIEINDLFGSSDGNIFDNIKQIYNFIDQGINIVRNIGSALSFLGIDASKETSEGIKFGENMKKTLGEIAENPNDDNFRIIANEYKVKQNPGQERVGLYEAWGPEPVDTNPTFNGTFKASALNREENILAKINTSFVGSVRIGIALGIKLKLNLFLWNPSVSIEIGGYGDWKNYTQAYYELQDLRKKVNATFDTYDPATDTFGSKEYQTLKPISFEDYDLNGNGDAEGPEETEDPLEQTKIDIFGDAEANMSQELLGITPFILTNQTEYLADGSDIDDYTNPDNPRLNFANAIYDSKILEGNEDQTATVEVDKVEVKAGEYFTFVDKGEVVSTTTVQATEANPFPTFAPGGTPIPVEFGDIIVATRDIDISANPGFTISDTDTSADFYIYRSDNQENKIRYQRNRGGIKDEPFTTPTDLVIGDYFYFAYEGQYTDYNTEGNEVQRNGEIPPIIFNPNEDGDGAIIMDARSATISGLNGGATPDVVFENVRNVDRLFFEQSPDDPAQLVPVVENVVSQEMVDQINENIEINRRSAEQAQAPETTVSQNTDADGSNIKDSLEEIAVKIKNLGDDGRGVWGAHIDFTLFVVIDLYIIPPWFSCCGIEGDLDFGIYRKNIVNGPSGKEMFELYERVANTWFKINDPSYRVYDSNSNQPKRYGALYNDLSTAHAGRLNSSLTDEQKELNPFLTIFNSTTKVENGQFVSRNYEEQRALMEAEIYDDNKFAGGAYNNILGSGTCREWLSEEEIRDKYRDEIEDYIVADNATWKAKLSSIYGFEDLSPTELDEAEREYHASIILVEALSQFGLLVDQAQISQWYRNDISLTNKQAAVIAYMMALGDVSTFGFSQLSPIKITDRGEILIQRAKESVEDILSGDILGGLGGALATVIGQLVDLFGDLITDMFDEPERLVINVYQTLAEVQTLDNLFPGIGTGLVDFFFDFLTEKLDEFWDSVSLPFKLDISARELFYALLSFNLSLTGDINTGIFDYLIDGRSVDPYRFQPNGVYPPRGYMQIVGSEMYKTTGDLLPAKYDIYNSPEQVVENYRLNAMILVRSLLSGYLSDISLVEYLENIPDSTDQASRDALATTMKDLYESKDLHKHIIRHETDGPEGFNARYDHYLDLITNGTATDLNGNELPYVDAAKYVCSEFPINNMYQDELVATSVSPLGLLANQQVCIDKPTGSTIEIEFTEKNLDTGEDETKTRLVENYPSTFFKAKNDNGELISGKATVKALFGGTIVNKPSEKKKNGKALTDIELYIYNVSPDRMMRITYKNLDATETSKALNELEKVGRYPGNPNQYYFVNAGDVLSFIDLDKDDGKDLGLEINFATYSSLTTNDFALDRTKNPVWNNPGQFMPLELIDGYEIEEGIEPCDPDFEKYPTEISSCFNLLQVDKEVVAGCEVSLGLWPAPIVRSQSTIPPDYNPSTNRYVAPDPADPVPPPPADGAIADKPGCFNYNGRENLLKTASITSSTVYQPTNGANAIYDDIYCTGASSFENSAISEDNQIQFVADLGEVKELESLRIQGDNTAPFITNSIRIETKESPANEWTQPRTAQIRNNTWNDISLLGVEARLLRITVTGEVSQSGVLEFNGTEVSEIQLFEREEVIDNPPITPTPAVRYQDSISTSLWDEMAQVAQNYNGSYGDKVRSCQAKVNDIATPTATVQPGESIQSALNNNNVVRLAAGTHTINSTLSLNGKTLIGDGKVVINAAGVGTAVSLTSSKLANLEIANAADYGINFNGNNTVYKVIVSYTGYDTESNVAGFGFSGSGKSSSNNCIVSTFAYGGYNEVGQLPCTACFNGGNADGYSFKRGARDNIFIDTHSENNSDDGYDFWGADTTLIFFSTASNNGKAPPPNGRPTSWTSADGNGFKMRSSSDRPNDYNKGFRFVYKSTATGNKAVGMDQNTTSSTPPISLRPLLFLETTSTGNGAQYACSESQNCTIRP